jgi:hypothetical protein
MDPIPQAGHPAADPLAYVRGLYRLIIRLSNRRVSSWMWASPPGSCWTA